MQPKTITPISNYDKIIQKITTLIYIRYNPY